MNDIVIPLRRAMINEELRYTLRSICENFPHKTVWLSGYMPTWLKDIGYVEVNVQPATKYVKTANNILAACRDPRVSEDFYLFNDDFYIMKPVTGLKNMYREKLIDRIERFQKAGSATAYTRAMELTYDILKHLGVHDPLDYSVHVPILVNKHKWLEAWQTQLKYNPGKKTVLMRSFYGNFYNLGGEQIEDVKISEYKRAPTGEEVFLSSNSDSLTSGLIGEHIKERFKNPCKYEA